MPMARVKKVLQKVIHTTGVLLFQFTTKLCQQQQKTSLLVFVMVESEISTYGGWVPVQAKII